jgi:hypothetical protein
MPLHVLDVSPTLKDRHCFGSKSQTASTSRVLQPGLNFTYMQTATKARDSTSLH